MLDDSVFRAKLGDAIERTRDEVTARRIADHDAGEARQERARRQRQRVHEVGGAILQEIAGELQRQNVPQVLSGDDREGQPCAELRWNSLRDPELWCAVGVTVQDDEVQALHGSGDEREHTSLQGKSDADVAATLWREAEKLLREK